MWHKLSPILLSCSLLFSFVNPEPVKAIDVEADIKSTGILKVGIREDAPLFGLGTV